MAHYPSAITRRQLDRLLERHRRRKLAEIAVPVAVPVAVTYRYRNADGTVYDVPVNATVSGTDDQYLIDFTGTYEHNDGTADGLAAD